MKENTNGIGMNAFAPPLTEFPGAETQLYCPGYECTERGVRTAAGRLVCLHPILPVEASCDIETGELLLTVAYYVRGVWQKKTLPSAELASSNGVLALAGVGVAVTSENARALSTYLMHLYHLNGKAIRTRKSVSRLGWFPGEPPLFAPYAEDVTVECPPELRLRAEGVQPAGTFGEWLAAAAPFWKTDLTVRLVLDASFASALIGPMGLQPFFVHIWGPTGYGKTVLLQLAASVWGDPAPGRLITSFHSTTVGLEMNAAFLHDIPVFIDELQVAAGAAKSDFQQLIYMLGEGVGKTRGAKEGGLRRQYTWSNLVLSTGERPLNSEFSGGGAMNRVIELELFEPVCDDFAALLAAIQANHGHAGELFVNEVNRRRGCLRQLFEGHRRKLLTYGVTGKQAAAMAALLTADDLAGFAVMDPGGKTYPYPYDYASVLLLKENEVSAEARAVEYLFDKIVSNPARFNDQGESYEVWGKPMGVYTAVIGSEFDRIMREGGFDPKAVLSYAYQHGLLDINDERMRKPIRFGNKVVRCVVIRQKADEA